MNTQVSPKDRRTGAPRRTVRDEGTISALPVSMLEILLHGSFQSDDKEHD